MEIATIRTDVQGTLVQGIGGIFFFNESWTNKTPKADACPMQSGKAHQHEKNLKHDYNKPLLK